MHMYLIFSSAVKSSQASDEMYYQQQLFNFTYLAVTSPGSLVHSAEQHFATPWRFWIEVVHCTCQMMKLQKRCNIQQNVQQLGGPDSSVETALSWIQERWNLLLGIGCPHVNSALIFLVHLHLVPQILLGEKDKK